MKQRIEFPLFQSFEFLLFMTSANLKDKMLVIYGSVSQLGLLGTLWFHDTFLGVAPTEISWNPGVPRQNFRGSTDENFGELWLPPEVPECGIRIRELPTAEFPLKSWNILARTSRICTHSSLTLEKALREILWLTSLRDDIFLLCTRVPRNETASGGSSRPFSRWLSARNPWGSVGRESLGNADL